jgi:hypothetical protein
LTSILNFPPFSFGKQISAFRKREQEIVIWSRKPNSYGQFDEPHP